MKLKSLLQASLTIGFVFSQSPTASAGTVSLCKDVISKQEKAKGIPSDLLKAIAKVESGISPWAVNAKGRAHIFSSKEAAVRYIKQLVESGYRNFSVGCMQLHYASHINKFKSVEAMLEPEHNIAHAAKLIKILERRHGSMERAIKHYHSASPTHHNPYKNRVYGVWIKIRNPVKSKDTKLKTVSLQKAPSSKTMMKTTQQSPKIKFGVGGISKKKSQKI